MDTLLKQRLVGAIVLVALAVIFIPMLLEGPGPTLVPDMEDLPEPERLERELSLEPLPLPESGPGADSGAAERMLTQSGPSGSDGVSETESAAQAALPAHKPAQNVEDAAQADTPAPEAMPGSARPAPAKVAPAPEKTVLPARP
ncbi:MAG TPA: hypothetical protein ENJ79_07625, partial [Gammaproteobacteria bacterium]|nr:hypothetical protein [Gammaproteobacteria bacterium]